MITINELRQGYNQKDNKSGRLEKQDTFFHPIGGVIQEFAFSYSLNKNVYLYKFRNHEGYAILIENKEVLHHEVIDKHTSIMSIADFIHKYGNIRNYVLQTYDHNRLITLMANDLAIQKKYVYHNTNIRIKNLFFGKHWNVIEETDGHLFKNNTYKNEFKLNFSKVPTFTKEKVVDMISCAINNK